MADWLRRVLEEHTLPLLEGFESVPTPLREAHRDAIMGSVNLTGEQDVRGSVGVSGSLETLASTAPFQGVDPLDWTGELANLIAGRFKYGLLRERRLVIRQSPPEVVRGGWVPRPGPNVAVLYLSGPRGSMIRVWAELRGFDKARTPGGGEEGLAAGESTFF